MYHFRSEGNKERIPKILMLFRDVEIFIVPNLVNHPLAPS